MIKSQLFSNIVNRLRSAIQYLYHQNEQVMNVQTQTMELSSVVFLSTDHEVLVKGSISKGHMSYETDLLVSHTQLNRMLNDLRRTNIDFSEETFLKSEKIENNDTLYYADFSQLPNALVNISEMFDTQNIRQIRA